jgi:hypothetical protein
MQDVHSNQSSVVEVKRALTFGWYKAAPPTLPVLIYIRGEPLAHLALMLQPQIPPEIDGQVQNHQHRLRQTRDPTARLNVTISFKVDDLLKRLLDLHRLLVTRPAPEVVAVLSGAVGDRDGDPHAHVRCEDAEAEEGAVFVGGVGGADSADVGGHDDGGNEEGYGGCDKEDCGRPGFGLLRPGPAGLEAAGLAVGNVDHLVAGGEEFMEGQRHGGDHVEG